MSEEIEIELFSAEKSGDKFPPEDAAEFILWLQEKVDQVPKEFRDSAKIEISGYGYCDDNYCHVEIKYLRPKTEAELAEQAMWDKKREERIKEAGLEQLKRLKELYGDSE